MAKKMPTSVPSLTATPAPRAENRPTPAALDAGSGWLTAITDGPDGPTEADLRLVGSVKGGRRLLDLGCGPGHASLAFARQGAKVIAVDPRAECLAATRQLVDDEGIRIEVHEADLAELAFLRADTIDVAFSAFALAGVTDLNRVFRQVHRVLKPEAPLVFSLPHPAFTMLDPSSADPLRIVRAYDDATPIASASGDERVEHPRTIAEVFTGLTRANFKVDALVEPVAAKTGERGRWFADVMRHVPPAVVFRARKQGT